MDIKNTIEKIRNLWEAQNAETITKTKSYLADLAGSESVKELLRDLNLSKGVELFRDPVHGFVLLAYSEVKGTYRVPHNHGSCWVIYSVLDGEVEMGGYKLKGDSEVIQKSSMIMRNGDSNVYYSGEIHDTKCLSDKAVILRFTSCDLKEEEKLGRMKRFPL